MNLGEIGPTPYTSVSVSSAKEGRELFESVLSSKIALAPRKADKPIVLYGAGSLGKLAKSFFDHLGMPILCVVDKNADRIRSDNEWAGVQVIAPDEAKPADMDGSLLVVCIVTSPLVALRDELRMAGWRDVVFFYDVCEAYRDRHPLSNGWFLPEMGVEDVGAVRKVFFALDDVSRMYYLQFLAWRRLRVELLPGRLQLNLDNRFFIPEILEALHNSEVFVDCGAHVGSVVTKFLSATGGEYHRIYAIEADHRSFSALERNLAHIQNSSAIRIVLGDKCRKGNFCQGFDFASKLHASGPDKVDIVPLDELKTRATFVKMHLEGGELDALKGAVGTIRDSRPILAVTVYHSPDGVWRIPLFLMDNVSNYDFHMRLHSWGGRARCFTLYRKKGAPLVEPLRLDEEIGLICVRNMKKPLVSICIPNYNNGKYLEACLKSALAQTYANIEILLVDDGSSDNSLDIARKYSDRVKIHINARNLGQPKSTNECMRLCKGKYAVILHSDDQLLPEFASKLVPLLERYPDAVLAVGERIISDETGRHTTIAPFYNMDCIVPGLKQAKVFLMTSFLPCQVLMRRSAFESIGGVDERHIVNLDGLLWFKFSLAGDLAYIQDPVSVYRVHPEQTTARYNRTIDHMMEYYGTLSAMFKSAEHIPYLKGFFPDAVKRAAQLTVRYCRDVLREKDFALAGRFLSLAAVFDPKITEDGQYVEIKKCLSSSDPAACSASSFGSCGPRDRGFSYDPPDGARPVNRGFLSASDVSGLLGGKKIIIYGAGKIGKRISAALRQLGYEPEFFWDINASRIDKSGGLPILVPDFASIPRQERGSRAIIVTVFAKSVSKEIAGSLRAHGYKHVLSDRETINAIIYQACASSVSKGQFNFDINICHMCPVPKEFGRTCDIFEDHLAAKVAKGVSRLSGRTGKLVFPKLGILVSNKCNLSCRGCNHLRDMYKPGDSVEISKKDVLGDIRKVVQAVDMVNQIVIVGGEAFLHPELPGILSEVLHLPKIGIVQIITNGTVRPRDPSLFDLMADKRVIVEISGYGDKIPAALRGNVEDFMRMLTKHRVRYQYVNTLQWFDFGGFEKRCYADAQRSKVFSSCCFVSNDMFLGKLHKCSRSVFASYLKKIPEYASDCVDVRNCPEAELREQLYDFLANMSPRVCDHCNGTSTQIMAAGVQKTGSGKK